MRITIGSAGRIALPLALLFSRWAVTSRRIAGLRSRIPWADKFLADAANVPPAPNARMAAAFKQLTDCSAKTHPRERHRAE
jgi:hypothetical protein